MMEQRSVKNSGCSCICHFGRAIWLFKKKGRQTYYQIWPHSGNLIPNRRVWSC